MRERGKIEFDCSSIRPIVQAAVEYRERLCFLFYSRINLYKSFTFALGETLSGAMEAIQEFLKDHARKETCFLPADLDGQWETTLWGNITISGLMVDTDIRFGGTDITDLQCYLTSDSGNIILRYCITAIQWFERYLLRH